MEAQGSIQPMIHPLQLFRYDQTLTTSWTSKTGSRIAAAVTGGSTSAIKGVASAPSPA